MRVRFLLCFCVLLVLGSASCGRDGAASSAIDAPFPTHQAPALRIPPAAQLPALPSGRESMLLRQTSRDGIETFSRGSGASADGSSLILQSGPGTLSWAMYELPATDELQSLEVVASGTGGFYFVALGDYALGRWQLNGPYSSPHTVGLSSAAQSSPGGQMYAAVLAYGGGGAVVTRLTLSADHTNALPQADLQSDTQDGNVPLTVNFDASASSDSDGSISSFDYDFDGDGIFESLNAGPAPQFIYANAGTFEAAVRVTDNDGGQALASLSISPADLNNEAPAASLVPGKDSGPCPLTVDFDASGSNDPDGSVESYDYDFDDDGSYDSLDAGPSVSHDYTVRGIYTARLRVTDNDGAQGEATTTITAGAKPSIMFSASPANPLPGETVTLDVSNSISFDGGTIVNFQWDLDYDGTFEIDTDPLGVQETSYPAPGKWYFSVRAIDELGLSTTGNLWVDVRCWDNGTALDTSGNTGADPSLLLVNGMPAIVYNDVSNGDLRYIRASDASGSAWGSPQTLESTGSTGKTPSMAIIGGKPAIAFQKDSQLSYITAADADGSVWNSSVTVDAVGDTGYSPSLCVVNGMPAISYMKNGAPGSLRYLRASAADGSAWGSSLSLDSVTETGESSMLLVGGNPAIAYMTGANAKYIRASDVDGTAWAAASSLGAGSKYIDMAIVDGNPAVTWYGVGVNYVRAQDANGGSWPAGAAVSPDFFAGLGVSLKVVDGKPAIAVHSLTSSLSLSYYYALDADGADWMDPIGIDGTEQSGYSPSLLVVNGKPAVAYHDEISGGQDLHFIRSLTASGTP